MCKNEVLTIFKGYSLVRFQLVAITFVLYIWWIKKNSWAYNVFCMLMFIFIAKYFFLSTNVMATSWNLTNEYPLKIVNTSFLHIYTIFNLFCEKLFLRASKEKPKIQDVIRSPFQAKIINDTIFCDKKIHCGECLFFTLNHFRPL
jgi:hypothetical protein